MNYVLAFNDVVIAYGKESFVKDLFHDKLVKLANNSLVQIESIIDNAVLYYTDISGKTEVMSLEVRQRQRGEILGGQHD